MKRSEAVKKLAELFEEHSNNQQYKGYSHEGLADTFLQLAEQIGMKPPCLPEEYCQGIMSIYYAGYTFYQWDEDIQKDVAVMKAVERRRNR